MTEKNEPLARVSGWVATESDLELDDQGRIVVAGDLPVEVEADDDRLLLTHRSTEPVTSEARVEELRSLIPGRASTIGGTVTSDESGIQVVLTNPIYLDGLNHQTFSTALRELVGAVDALGPRTIPLDLPNTFEESEPGETAPEAAPVSAPAEPDPTREMPPAWVATHAVPSGGMSAWPEPNPEIQPSAHLEARVRVTVSERRGDWARVVGSNGWTGWVDARRLVELSKSETMAATGSAGSAVGSKRLNPLILAGALFTALSALLPWIDDGRNAMELTLKFLWDVDAQGEPFLGWGLMGLGALALGVAFLKKPLGPALLVGIATIATALLFVAQLYRVLSDLGGGFEELRDAVGFAPAVTVGGGILTLIGGAK
jgi:hypothetical protein